MKILTLILTFLAKLVAALYPKLIKDTREPKEVTYVPESSDITNDISASIDAQLPSKPCNRETS